MKFYTIFPIVLAGFMALNFAKAEDNVHFSGALVSEPCTLPDIDTDIHVDFGSVIVKYLYQYQRTKSQPFTIHLEDCDPDVMKTVSVTFEGSADDELVDMLALDPASSAKGVAIGLEDSKGTPIALNKPGDVYYLDHGSNALKFNAYVQASSIAISKNEIVAGDFSAISTFVLNYQ
ncbi:fimbrial protein [Citrobacter amalonaticus]|uniref:fimbrial protein n=1 Tax=Citrobacter amalonaticus TaxID=35703 RepID=UPI00300CC6C3